MNIKNLLTFLILFTSSFHSYSQIYKLDAKTFLDINISKKEYKIEQLENEISNNSYDHSLLLNKAVRFKVFFDAQDIATKKFSENCPNISSNINLSNKLIQDNYKAGIEISNYLINIAKLKEKNFSNDYQKLFSNFENEYSSYFNFSDDNCNSILQEFIKRKDGYINGKFNQNIISIENLLNPVNEIFNNDFQLFSTYNNHTNSDFFLTVQLPKSWDIKEKENFSYSSTIGFFEPYEKFLNASVSISLYPSGVMSKEEMKKNKITDEILLNEIYSDNETLYTIITSFNKDLKNKKINCTLFNNGNLKYILYIAEGDLGNITDNSLLKDNIYKSINALTIKNGEILKLSCGTSYKINEFNSFNYYSKLFFKIMTSVKIKQVQSNTIYLTEKENMKFLNVSINNNDYEFMIDTGATNVVINKNMLNEFLVSGYINQTNFITKSKAKLADGNEIITEEWLFPEIKIKNQIVKNITISVVNNNNSVPLFGMDGLKKLNVQKLNLNENEILIKQ
jgi:predicted aspartyl protease